MDFEIRSVFQNVALGRAINWWTTEAGIDS